MRVKRSRKFTLYAVLMAVLLSVGVACGDDDTPTPSTTGTDGAMAVGGELRVAVGSLGEETFYTPDGISPILSGPYDMPLAIPREGEGDLKLLPGLVESWELTDNARTLTLTLKSGMKWHDGEKVTADDLVSHANRVRDPEATGSGAPEWADLISDVEKVDDLTVRLKGTAAFAAFSFQLSFAMGIREALVTPEHVTKDSLKNEPVGTGPWKFASHTRGVSITFDAVDEDFQLAGGRVRPQFDSMTLIRAPEASTRVAMLKTGAADVAELNWPTAKQVQVDPNIRILSIPGAEYLMMGFLGLTSSSRSGSIAGFADSPQGWPAGLPNTDILEVREAMMKAIDFNKLNDLFYGGLAEPTPFYRSTKASIIYDATDMRFHIPFIEPDLNAARQLMADAGFPITCEVKPRRPDRPEGATFEDCTGGWKQPLWVPTTSGSYGTTMLDVAAIIADDWARIGLETELKPMDFNTFRFRYFSNMDPHNPDGWGHAFLGISSGDPVPSVASRFKRGQGRNQMFLSDEFEALFAIEDAAETFDELKAAKVASNYETAKVFAESAILLHGLPIGAVEGITGWKPYPGNPDARGHNFESIAHS